MAMKMKLKTLAAACALACASSGAYAAACADGHNTVIAGAPCQFDAPAFTFYIAGASAPQNFISALAGGLFQGNPSVDWYSYADSATTGTDFRAYFGLFKTTAMDPAIPASLSGQKVLIINRARGGSIFGVNTMVRNQSVAVLQVDSTCTGPGGGYDELCSVTGVDGVSGKVPDLGVSDVEPAMFQGPYNLDQIGGVVQPVLTAAELAKLKIQNTAINTFGAPVSTQVPLSDISSADMAALLSGGYTDWGSIHGAGSGTVVVCRRTTGSGTQATYNAYFNKFPCAQGKGSTIPASMAVDSVSYDTTGDPLSVPPGKGTTAHPYVLDPSAGYTVVEGPASGDVRNCLQNANLGTDYTFTDANLNVTVVKFSLGGPYKAIGVLSLDSATKTNGADVGASSVGKDWKWLTLDGIQPVDPTQAAGAQQNNLLNGNYGLIGEQTMQYLKAGLPAATVDFDTLFVKRAGSQAVLVAIGGNNSAVARAIGVIPSPTQPPTLDVNLNSTNKVSKWSKGGNTCAPITLSY